MGKPKQTRIPGTDGDPVPDNVHTAIMDLKKRRDSCTKAKAAEKKAQETANQACLDAGYKPGQRVELPDESPPLWFEVRQPESKVVVKVLGRKKDDPDATGEPGDDK